MRQGEPLPPIEVWAWRGKYYVLDGHHRVAAARALGIDYISANVIEVVELSRHEAKALGSDGRSAAPDSATTDRAQLSLSWLSQRGFSD
jgi:hypothetical protein